MEMELLLVSLAFRDHLFDFDNFISKIALKDVALLGFGV